MIPIGAALFFSAAMFVIGFIGVITRRNLIVMLMCIEIMLNGANLSIVAFAQRASDPTGHIIVLFAIAIAAAEVAVGLVIAILLYRLRKSVDPDGFGSLKL